MSKRAAIDIHVREKILNRDKKCIICGSKDNLEIHHIKPVFKGGLDTPHNLILLCGDCHRFAPNDELLFNQYKDNKIGYIAKQVLKIQCIKNRIEEIGLTENIEEVFKKAIKYYCELNHRKISQRTKEGLEAARSRGKKVAEDQSLMIIKRKLYMTYTSKRK